MRYKIGETGADATYGASTHIVELTIFITFIIGIGFLLAGHYGKQMRMKFWGILTILTCAGFWIAQAMGIFTL